MRPPRLGPAALPAFVALAALAAPAAGATPEPCGAPALVDGQPTAVVVVMDGINSTEPDSGTAYPIPVPRPAAGIPAVSSYCPVDAAGRERRFPPGIDAGLRRWALLDMATACRPAGGLATDRCFVARLADTGAIVLPYSYSGARVERTPNGPVFHFTGYLGRDTQQPPAVSVANLDRLIASIVTAWPRAYVYVAAHSYGGVVAEAWWRQAQQRGRRPARVERVFTLDSPINGVERCLPALVVVGPRVSEELCRRWYDRDALDRTIARLARDGSFVAIGTDGDPSYASGLTLGGGGNLRPQVVYSCPDSGELRTSRCIAMPPSFLAPLPLCDGAGPGIDGATGHFVVHACPAVVRKIVSAPAARPPALRLERRCGARGRLRLRVTGDVWAVSHVGLRLGRRRVGPRLAAPFERSIGRRRLALANGKRLRAVVRLERGGKLTLSRRLPRCTR